MRVYAENTAGVGGGEPKGLAVESDTAAGVGCGGKRSDDGTCFYLQQIGLVVFLIQNPEPFRSGLESIRLGARRVERKRTTNPGA